MLTKIFYLTIFVILSLMGTQTVWAEPQTRAKSDKRDPAAEDKHKLKDDKDTDEKADEIKEDSTNGIESLKSKSQLD